MYFTCVGFAMGMELFGDSSGKVWVFEQNALVTTMDVWTAADGPVQPAADLLDQQIESAWGDKSRSVLAMAPLGRGFVAVSESGTLSISGQRQGR